MSSYEFWRFDAQSRQFEKLMSAPLQEGIHFRHLLSINDVPHVVSQRTVLWFNSNRNRWQPKSQLPEFISSVHYGFMAGGKGYILADSARLTEKYGAPLKLWEYDPVLDQWTNIRDDFPDRYQQNMSIVSNPTHTLVGMGHERIDYDIEFKGSRNLWKFR